MNEAIESIHLSVEEEFEIDGVPSLDDFMRELEEREKMLEISIPKVKKHSQKQETDTSHSDTNQENNSKTSRQSHDLIERFQSKISLLEKEKEEFLSTMRRRQVDFESFKNRTEREKSETFQNLASSLASKILPVVDNIDRALNSANSDKSENRSVEFTNFVEGIALVSQQLFSVLTEMGVETIPTVGQTFDPHLHEAVATEKSVEFAPNTVTGELQRGYRIGNKIIRASMVKVAF